MALRLRIATFNLEDLGEPAEGEPSLGRRAQVLRPQLERLDADILCLQEVNAQEKPGQVGRALAVLDYLLESTRYGAFHRAATHSPSGGHLADKHNLVLLSRWPIESSGQILHDLVPPISHASATASSPEPLALRFDRPLLHAATVLPGGKRLHVLNLHLKAPLAVPIPGQKLSAFKWRTVAGWAEGFYLAAMKRAGQALECRLFVDRLLDVEPGALIAVCGDFNAESHEVPVRLIAGNVDDTGNSTLDSRVLHCLDDQAAPAARYSVIHGGRRVLLDHLLVSPTLREGCQSVTILNEGLADEAAAYAAGQLPLGSFHAPIVAEFMLAG
jgi:endonuclease/exonuclease/phosphatase family metal-dependent hydrolase